MTHHALPRRCKRRDTRGVSATGMVAERAVKSTLTRSMSGVQAWPAKLLRSPHELAVNFSGTSIAMAYWACRSVVATRVSERGELSIFPSSWSSSPDSHSLSVCMGRADIDALNAVKPTKQLTFFDNAKSTLSTPLFTVDLRKNAPGSYNFGFIDNSKYTGSITYVPVDSSRGFWEFTGKGYLVGSNGSFKSVSIDAIADTGTSLLYLPDAVVQDYYGAVPSASYSSSQGGYTFPCGTSLPSISLSIGDYPAVIPGSFLNYAPIDDSGSGKRTSFYFLFFLSPDQCLSSLVLSSQKQEKYSVDANFCH